MHGSVARTVSRLALTFAGMAGFLLLIVAAGLVAGLVSGLPGLALFAGIFLVALMVLARSEGLI